MDIQEFDVISYLEDRNIVIHTSGKNITRGWINIQCPFCDDPSWHCGINLESKLFHCWRCENKGSSLRLVKEIDGVSDNLAESIIRLFREGLGKDPISDTLFSKNPFKNDSTWLKQGVFPKGTSPILPKLHLNYLKSRNFDPEMVIQKYKIQACHNLGKHKFRIIVPVFIQKQMIGFVGADVTRKAILKYKNSSDEESIISLKSIFYNMDNCSDSVVIVEGILDVWRLGDGAVASLGKIVTDQQINFLLRNNIKEVFILPDSDAIENGKKLSEKIGSLFDHVELLELVSGDPADLSNEEARNLMKDLTGH